MATTFQLLYQQVALGLIYNASTQPEYAAMYGIQLGTGQPEIIYHQADNGARQPVYASDPNGQGFFTMDVTDSTINWDNIANNVARLKRTTSGAYSHAIRGSIYEIADDVTLRVQLDGATNYVDWRVTGGFIDDRGAYLDSVAAINTRARGVVFYLETAPYGEGARIYLHNELPPSPHMLFAGSTAGLAEGLTLIGSPASYSLSKQRYIIEQSQEITVNSTGKEGFQFATISASIGVTAIASVYVSPATSADDLTIILTDGSGTTIQSKTLTYNDGGGVASLTYTDPNGYTWYKVVVTGTNAAADFILQAYRASGDAVAQSTYYFDLGYFDTGRGRDRSPYPYMDVDKDSDGIVDGWRFNGGGTPSIDSTYYFSTAKSQRITGGGYLEIVFNAAVGTVITATLWIFGQVSPTDVVEMTLLDGAWDTIQEKSFDIASPAGYEQSGTGDDTRTWYQYKLTGTNTAGNFAVLRVNVDTVNAVVNIDDVFIITGTLASSPAWASSANVWLRGDHDTSNPERVNYIDTFNFPGTAPAMTDITVLNADTSPESQSYLQMSRSVIRGDSPLAWIESNDSSRVTDSGHGVTWSDPTGAAYTGGSYLNGTKASAQSTYVYYDITGDEARKWMRHTQRIFALVKMSNTASRIRLTTQVGDTGYGVKTLHVNDWVAPVATGVWELVSLGTSNTPGVFYRRGAIQDTTTIRLYLDIDIAASDNVGIDFILPMIVDPQSDSFVLAQSDSARLSQKFTLGGRQRFAYDASDTQVSSRGGIYIANAGEVVNRYTFMVVETNYTVDIAKNLDVTIEATPRTTSIFGVL